MILIYHIFYFVTDVGVRPLNTNVRRGSIVDNRPFNPIRLDTSIRSIDLGVAGTSLWRLSSYGSSNENGAGTRFAEQTQILNQRQQDQSLPAGGDELDFEPIEMNFDMSGLGCADVRYICTTISRNPQASIDFTLDPQPDISALTSCQPINCEGKFHLVVCFVIQIVFKN